MVRPSSRRPLGWSLRRLFDWLTGQRTVRPRRPVRLAVEWLENRLTPSTFTVDNTSPFASVDGSLASAVAQADADASGTPITINFAAGTGQVFATAQTIDLKGTLDLDNATTGASITIQGPAAGLTIAGGGSTSNFAVFKIESGTTATLSGLTVTNGVAKSGGAGIDNLGTLVVSNVIVAGNSATAGASGGGILNAVGATLTVNNGKISGNSAAGSGGGIENLGTATVTGTTLSTNTAAINGGGIDNGATLTLVNSTLTTNSATNTGGGLQNNDGSATVSGSALLDNNATSGGGAFDANHGTLTVLNSTVANNTAGDGAGLFVDLDSTLAVTADTITGNTANGNSDGGGGIDDYHTLLLSDSIVASNLGGTTPDINANGQTITGGHDLIGVNSNLAAAGLSNGQNGNIIGQPNTLLANLANHTGTGGTWSVALLPGSTASGAAGAVTTVADAAGATDTTITLTNAAAIASSPGQFAILINGEEMTVTSVDLTNNTVTVIRNVSGTSATPAVGDSVFLFEDQRGITRPTGGGDIGSFQDQGFTLTPAANSTSQSTSATTAFAKPLTVTAASKDMDVTLTGGIVTFTAAPGGSGQSATLSAATATINLSDQATVTATANADIGAYTVTAGIGTTTATFSLTNTAAPPSVPAFTSAAQATFTVGTNSTFVITASGSPAPLLAEKAGETPPSGLTFDPATGDLSGTPAAGSSGTYTLHFTATNASGSVAQTLTLSVNGPPVITSPVPTSSPVTAGSTFTLVAAASGVPTPTVQWQVSTDGGTTFTNIAGATSTTLAFTATAARNGDEFQAVFTNSAGSATTSAATLAVDFAPIIATQPTNQGVSAAGTATFTAAANADPAVSSVQWYVETPGNTGFFAVPNATSPTLSVVEGVNGAVNGTLYRAIFTNSVGATATQTAKLVVGDVPTITVPPPATVTTTAGQTVTLHAAATSTAAPTVQWQVEVPGGSFTNIAGATKGTLSFTASASQNGNLYQAVFTNAVGTKSTSPTTLNVKFAPQITTQPTNQATGDNGTATFTAAVNANPTVTPLQVQWQVKSPGGGFTNVTTGVTTTGNSTTLSLTNVPASDNGDLYRVVFKNALGTVTTKAATLAVGTAPAIAAAGQPTAPTANIGQPVVLTASATGTPTPTVQWQTSTNGGTTWTNVAGATSTSLKFNATAAENGQQYRAVFTNALGTATTNAVTLTVNEVLLITQQPANEAVAVGGTAAFVAAVNANPSATVTVQWEQESPGATNFSPVTTNGTSPTLTISGATASQSGTKYFAEFSNSAGTVTTNTVTMTVDVAPTLTKSPTDTAAQAGQTITFTAAATGTPAPAVQWQVSTNAGTTYTNVTGATSTNLTLTAAASANGNLYRAVFTNPVGQVDSTAAKLVIW